jgi:hypothetical protein
LMTFNFHLNSNEEVDYILKFRGWKDVCFYDGEECGGEGDNELSEFHGSKMVSKFGDEGYWR